jgi:hypothetical protein
MQRDISFGALRLNLSANRRGVTVSYYAQDVQHQSGLAKIRLATLTADELNADGLDAAIDITPLLPIARELFLQSGGKLGDEEAA